MSKIIQVPTFNIDNMTKEQYKIFTAKLAEIEENKIKNLLTGCLSKYPLMVVTGFPINQEQSLEIIRKTDTFITKGIGYSGNDNHYNKEIKDILKLKYSDDFSSYDEYIKWKEKYFQKWGIISTEYILNNWISTNYFGGYDGWCHPDGEISYNSTIGKDPSVQDVYEDWVKIASAFNFLDIGITLFYDSDNSDRANYPVVSFAIENGQVDVIDPKDFNVHKEHNLYKQKLKIAKDLEITRTIEIRDPEYLYTSRRQLAPELLQEWSDKIFSEIN
jgi:hypothetical protein